MNDYTFLLKTNDPSVHELFQISLLTAEGNLIDNQGRTWAYLHNDTRLVTLLNGNVIACLISGSGSGALVKTFRILQPLATCPEQTINLILNSEISIDGLSLAYQNQTWASANPSGQMVSIEGQYVGNLLQITGASISIFTAVPVSIQIAEGIGADSAACLNQAWMNSEGFFVNTDGIIVAQADSQGSIHDLGGRLIGSVCILSSRKSLCDQGFEVYDCSNPELQRALETSLLWDSAVGTFMSEGQVVARVSPGSNQIQLPDGVVVGAIRPRSEGDLSEVHQAAADLLDVVPDNCLKRMNHNVFCQDDSLRERLLRSVLDENGCFNVYQSNGAAHDLLLTTIAFLHPNQRHIMDQNHRVIGEFFQDPTVPLPLRTPPESSQQRTQRCTDELNRYDQFWLQNATLDSPVGEETAMGTTGISKKTDFEPIPDINVEAPSEIVEFEEQEKGITEPDFDAVSWKKAIDADKTEKTLKLLAYSRPKIEPQSSLVAAEIVRDAETMFNVMHGKIQGSQFTFLFLDGLETVLEKKIRANLGKYLNKFSNLECLGLRKAGIRRLDKLSLPKLNQLVISYNLISDASALVNCVSGLPGLQIFDFRENPILFVKGFDQDLLPLADHPLWQTLLVKCPFITLINDCLIDPARKSRAMSLSKTKAVRNARAWDIFLLSLEQIPDMAKPEFEQEFAASAIASLDLHSKGLSAIWMHKFVNVRSLNLCGNELVSIDNCGLEKMQSLQDLNLSYNRLKKLRNYRNLNVLGLLGSLQRLWLQGNVELKNYRTAVIYVTRQLRGTNRTLGLLELDDCPINIEERVEAVGKFRNKHEAIETRLRLNLILEYGHQQIISIADFLAKITTLSLSDRSLVKINVAGMPNLQLLNVARNQLSIIENLQTLSKLRILDAAQNPSFKIGSTLKQLKSNQYLERVAIFRIPEKVDSSHIKSLLTALLPKNVKLSVLEAMQIDFLDRMSCLAKIHKKDKNINMDVYRTNLALLQCATPLVGRNYSYEESAPGKQYQPSDLIHIRAVSYFDLKVVDLSIFTNLVVVNLSFNSLSTLPAGLLNLQKLEQLDLRSNKINISIKQLAETIDGLVALEILHIRGNPFMRTASDRAKLIALIGRMKQVECSLRILDSPVSIDERVDSWLAHGGSQDQAETLRYRAAIFLRVQKGMETLQVLELDLSSTNIAIVLLSSFPNLRKLNLGHNRLQRISGTDIDKMTQLRVLDLGQNQLSNLQDVVIVVNCLPQLIFLTLSGNALSGSYRTEFIRSCSHFTRINNKLIYLDHDEVSVSEIISSNKDFDESFRFDLAVYRRTSPPLETEIFERQALVPDHEEVVQLDLSLLELKVVNMCDFSSLRFLRLSNNQIETNPLSKSSLDSCKKLEYLYLDHNLLTKLPKIASIVSRLSKIRVLDLISNPCFPEASKSDRHKFLKEWPNIENRSFPLRLLDGSPVTVRERIKATHNIPSNLIEDARLDLTIFERQRRLENGELDPNQTNIDLSNSDLQVVKQCFTTLRMLQEVNLNDNALTTFADQGLESLPHLRHLQLCRNQFSSLDNLLETLSLCHSLKVVYLEQSTTDGRTKTPESYVDVVGFRLRGVSTIDDQANPNLLEGMQLDAQQFLWNVAGVGPNQCVYVDISNRNIAAELFFYVMAALAELRTVTTLKSNGNQWNRGEKRILNYRQFIIFGLGRTLLTLDDEPILDDERLNAIEFIQKEESRAGGTSRVHKGGWVATKDRAIAQHHKLTGAQARKNIQTGPGFTDNEKLTSVMAGDNKSSSVNQVRANLSAASELVNESVQMAAPLLQVTGSVLVKFEIMINFLQMYSLIYAINVTIPWPKVWIDFSRYFLLLSFDIEFIFPLHWKDLAVLKFIATLAVPLVFVAIYFLGDSLDVEIFRRRFVTNWKSSRANAIRLFVLCVIISAGISALQYQENVDLVLSGHFPNPEFNGLFVTIMAPVVGLLTLWSLLAWRFRENCIDVEPNEFLRWWYKRTYFLRRVSLFALTILFMPVARVIMQQFQCDGSHLVVYPDRPCVSENIYPVQITAFGFAVVYIIGLPIFFGRLISKATKMIDSHGYADEAAVYTEIISVLSKQAKHDKDIRKKIKDAHEHLDTFYANEVAQNPVPQTYLYGAYQRRFRYFKLLQMFQKLAVVLLTMFIPQDILIRNSKLFLGNAIVFFSTVLAIVFRPFQDKYESILEILSQVANIANITTAILLDMGFPQILGAAILVLFNGLSWATFAFTVLAAPIRALLANRKFLKQQRVMQDAMKAAEQLVNTAVSNGKEAINHSDQRETAVEAGQSVRILNQMESIGQHAIQTATTSQPTADAPQQSGTAFAAVKQVKANDLLNSAMISGPEAIRASGELQIAFDAKQNLQLESVVAAFEEVRHNNAVESIVSAGKETIKSSNQLETINDVKQNLNLGAAETIIDKTRTSDIVDSALSAGQQALTSINQLEIVSDAKQKFPLGASVAAFDKLQTGNLLESAVATGQEAIKAANQLEIVADAKQKVHLGAAVAGIDQIQTSNLTESALTAGQEAINASQQFSINSEAHEKMLKAANNLQSEISSGLHNSPDDVNAMEYAPSLEHNISDQASAVAAVKQQVLKASNELNATVEIGKEALLSSDQLDALKAPANEAMLKCTQLESSVPISIQHSDAINAVKTSNQLDPSLVLENADMGVQKVETIVAAAEETLRSLDHVNPVVALQQAHLNEFQSENVLAIRQEVVNAGRQSETMAEFGQKVDTAVDALEGFATAGQEAIRSSNLLEDLASLEQKTSRVVDPSQIFAAAEHAAIPTDHQLETVVAGGREALLSAHTVEIADSLKQNAMGAPNHLPTALGAGQQAMKAVGQLQESIETVGHEAIRATEQLDDAVIAGGHQASFDTVETMVKFNLE